MKKLIPAIALVTLGAQAASMSMATITNTAKKIKEKSSMAFLLENYASSKENALNVKDVSQYATAYYKFKLSKNTAAQATVTLATTTDTLISGEGEKVSYGWSSVRYKHSNILTEKKNGVGLHAQVRAYFNNPDYTDESANIGSINPRVYLTKSINKKLSATVGVLAYKYIHAANETEGTRDHRFYLNNSLAYQINDKLSASASLDFDRKVKNSGDSTLKITTSPNLDINLAKNLTLSVAYEMKLASKASGSSLESAGSEGLKNGTAQAHLYWKAF